MSFIFQKQPEPPIEFEISSETMDLIFEANIAVIRAQPGHGKPVAKPADVVKAPGPTKRELRRRMYAGLANAR